MTETAIPGPRGQWLVGQLPAYERDRMSWLRTNQARYGDFIRLAPHAVVVLDPDAAQQIFTQTNDTYLLDNAIVVNRRTRAAMAARLPLVMRRRILASRAMVNHLTTENIDGHVATLSERLRAYAGRDIDLFTSTTAVCGTATAWFSFGGGTRESRVAEIADASLAAFYGILKILEVGEVRVPWLPRPAARKAIKENDALRALIREEIAARRAATPPPRPRDLLDELLRISDDDADVAAAVRLVVFTAPGVPGAASSWITLRLAEQPELAARIADEASGPLSIGQAIGAHALPAADHFLREVLRLHPPQWMLSRTALRPTRLGPYLLETGQQVMVCTYLIHRDPRWWDDPETFSPQRWQRAPERGRYLPFGGGPRGCPGSPLAKIQLMALTSLLARDYHLRVRHGDTEFGGLLKPSDAFAVMEPAAERSVS